MTMIIEVPILPHLKKFILNNPKTPEPYKLSMRNVLGVLAYSILISKRKMPRFHEKYSDTIALEFGAYFDKMDIRVKHLAQLNNYVDKLFKEAMVTWVAAKSSEFIAEREAIRTFLRYYHIQESDYGLDTAYRHWMRSKNPPQKKTGLSSQFDWTFVTTP